MNPNLLKCLENFLPGSVASNAPGKRVTGPGKPAAAEPLVRDSKHGRAIENQITNLFRSR